MRVLVTHGRYLDDEVSSRAARRVELPQPPGSIDESERRSRSGVQLSTISARATVGELATSQSREVRNLPNHRETAAQENASSYFPLLDRIADGHFIDYTTEKELYEEFLKVLSQDGHLRDEEAISLFQLALSLHVAAPRIEAQYQYYSTSVEPLLMIAQDAACPVWVHFSGKQYCSPSLERAQQDFSGPAFVFARPTVRGC